MVKNYPTNKPLQPLHISHAYAISPLEKDLDFFDANLMYDSRLFIDPFLLKTSPVREERELFKRFSVFFRHAYRQSLSCRSQNDLERLKNLLSFKEPRELCIGYTKFSNQGSGLGSKFASVLLNFLLKSTASKLIDKDDLYPDNIFDPNVLDLITEGLGPDGISDLTARLIMDYLIDYTVDQCKAWGIPLKSLPVEQVFDFKDLDWVSRYTELPENPIKLGEPVIFVPKRLLRAGVDMQKDKPVSRVVGLLREDPILSNRFASLISKNISDISLSDIQNIISREESILTRYLEVVGRDGAPSYDFERDPLGMMYIKKYWGFFQKLGEQPTINTCEQLIEKTKLLINEFNDELTMRGAWKDMWQGNRPCKEEVFGRLFRAMGHAFFCHFPNVTFDAEIGTGHGFLDFRVIAGACKICIEVKNLNNSSRAGEPSLPAYRHGIERQLPHYIVEQKSKYGIYITGQHWNQTKSKKVKKPKDHTLRKLEIESLIPEIINKIKAVNPYFNTLLYFNIDLSPRHPPSKL